MAHSAAQMFAIKQNSCVNPLFFVAKSSSSDLTRKTPALNAITGPRQIPIKTQQDIPRKYLLCSFNRKLWMETWLVWQWAWDVMGGHTRRDMGHCDTPQTQISLLRAGPPWFIYSPISINHNLFRSKTLSRFLDLYFLSLCIFQPAAVLCSVLTDRIER